MNKKLNFEISKLLKEKGFDEKCSHYYIDNFQNFKHDGELYKTELPQDWQNDNIFQFVKRTKQPHLCNAPSISHVITWLYDKHKIWISVYTMDKWLPNGNDREQLFDYSLKQMKLGLIDIPKKPEEFDTPEEAYESAILYALKTIL